MKYSCAMMYVVLALDLLSDRQLCRRLILLLDNDYVCASVSFLSSVVRVFFYFRLFVALLNEAAFC